VVALLVGAFRDDPVWGWSCPDPALRTEQHRQLWGAFVDGALRYPWVWLTGGGAATAVWIPPGGTEMSDEQEADLDRSMDSWPGEAPARVRHAMQRFEQAHPLDEPHYYLSLLGTGAEHRGHGYGLGLLAETLRLVDEDGAPAYLEASNVANVPLYERYGFRPFGSFGLDDGPEVVTMWRSARPTA
jgi:GNAT superfamily N-acetyltransferase